jgi:hypothetical protein
MTAAITYAGTLYGQMIGLGVQDETGAAKRRIRAMNERNFNTGVEVGKKQVSRAVHKLGSVQ